jgi:peptide/nickel transport system substrate-binding protein
LQLEAHDAYWGGTPPLASLEFRAVPELSARIAGLFAGDYDICNDVSPDSIAQITRRPGFNVVGGPSTLTRLVNMDVLGNPQLQDVWLRRALSLAVDRSLLVETLWAGRATVPNGLQSPSFGNVYDPERAVPRHDAALAREVLRHSSYRGEPIPFRTLGNNYVAELATVQTLIEMWRSVGINVVAETIESWPNLYRRPGAGLYNYASGAIFPDPISDLWRVYGEPSLVQRVEQTWRNEEFNRLGQQLDAELDPAVRRRAFQRMLDIFDWEDPPAILLHRYSLFYGIRPGLEWRPWPGVFMNYGPGHIRASS